MNPYQTETLYPLRVALIKDPTVATFDEKAFTVIRGGDANTFYRQPASSGSMSSFQFNIVSPSQNAFIDRRIHLQATFRLEFTGETPDPGQDLLQSGRDSIRSLPLQRLMNTASITLNGQQSTIDMSDFVDAWLQYAPEEMLKYNFSGSPVMQDQTQSYEMLEDSIRNPLNAYHDSIQEGLPPRGAFSMIVETNTDTAASVLVTLIEPLLMSPCYYGSELKNGFLGVQNMAFQFNLKSNPERYLWSHLGSLATGGSDINSVAVSLVGNPEIIYRALNPSSLVMSTLPQITTYPYSRYTRNLTTFASLAAGSSRTDSSQAIQIDIIPRRLIVYLKRVESERTINTPDCYLPISGINITFSNQSGLLGGATQYQLYQIARRNGCNLTYSQWSADGMPFLSGSLNTRFNGPGGVLVLNLPEDLTLQASDSMSPGMALNTNLQMNVTYSNKSLEAITPQLCVITEVEGVFNLYSGQAQINLAVVNPNNIVNAQEYPGLSYSDIYTMGTFAGGAKFFDKIGAFFKRLPGDILKGINWTEENILPVVQKVLPLVKLALGSGYTGGSVVNLSQLEGVPSSGLVSGGLDKKSRRRRF